MFNGTNVPNGTTADLAVLTPENTEQEKEREPMLVTRTLVAVGFVGAMAMGTAAPSVAQGVYIGPGGVGIDTGRPAYRERYYRGDRSED